MKATKRTRRPMRFKMSRLISTVLSASEFWHRQANAWMREAPAPARPARPRARPRQPSPILQETRVFGRNPGNLRMLDYAPPGLPAGAPLVVVLHGCLQTAQEFDHASGWSHLARAGGFAVLYPEQKSVNNSNLCFNWFRPSAASRDRGEIQSIRQMIDHMQRRHRLGPVHVFGLSAGGAMAAALMAGYPSLITAGAIVAGLPFGAARDAMGAMAAMRSGAGRSASAWGDLARANAAEEEGPWPALSIWHGEADRVVSVSNAQALADQWLDLHGFTREDGEETIERAATLRRWRDGSGRVLVEQRLFAGLDHALPISAARLHRLENKEFYVDIGLCAATEMARRWKLSGRQPAGRARSSTSK